VELKENRDSAEERRRNSEKLWKILIFLSEYFSDISR
jgi:hypothetical protein